MDSSLVEADASVKSIINPRDLKTQLTKQYHLLEQRLEDTPINRTPGPESKTNNRKVSTTDPDASMVRRGKAKLRYQVHRAVEGQPEVITATETTTGDVNEAHRMLDLLEEHQRATGIGVETAVADSKYGTKENYLACMDAGINAHIPCFNGGTKKRLLKRGLFMEDRFRYNSEREIYTCPAGQELKRKSYHKHRKSYDYSPPKRICAECDLRDQCTKNKMGRTITRHVRQEDLDKMEQRTTKAECRSDLRLRQHLGERSFATATRYGYKHARWRRLWRLQIQDYLTCTLQNIMKLVKHENRRVPAVAVARSTWRSPTLGPSGAPGSRFEALGGLLAILLTITTHWPEPTA